MKQINKFLLIPLLIVSCNNKDHLEIYTYYKDGKVKTRKVLHSADDTLNYYLESYYPDGTIFQKGQFKNGKTEGLVKEYYENGKLKTIASYINGLKNGCQQTFNLNGNIEKEFYFENDTVLLIYHHVEDKGVKVYTKFKGKQILIGMLTIEDESVVKEKSYYYVLHSNDTLKKGNEETVRLEVFNRGNTRESIEVVLADRFGKFESVDGKTVRSDSLATQFQIKPNKCGYAILSGVINIQNKSSDVVKQFYLHKLYYIENN